MPKKLPIFLCLAWLCLTCAASAQSFNKAALEAYLRHLYIWPPPIQIEITDPKPSPIPGLLEVQMHASQGALSQDEVLYLSKDGSQIVRGHLYNTKQNPFKDNIDKLKTEFQPSAGTPGAPVVLVEFSDFQCPYCKEEAKMLHDNLLSTYPKQVRLYFMDYPLEQLHPWAKAASIAGRCVFRQNAAAFWQYHDWMFEHQTEITPENLKSKVLEFAKDKEIDTIQLTRCMDAKETEAEITKTMAMGRAAGIASTPSLFINGRPIAGAAAWPDLKRVIDYEIDYQKTAKNAGEDCGCDLKLPTIGVPK